jgi:hypothetical protein
MGGKLIPAAVGGLAVLLAAALLGAPPAAQGQRAERLPRWEYKAVVFDGAAPVEAHSKRLNELAADGWEYAGPVAPTGRSFDRYVVAFRRAKP